MTLLDRDARFISISPQVRMEIEQYQRKRSSVFLPKAEIGLRPETFQAYLQSKEEISSALVRDVKRLSQEFLGHEPTGVECITSAGTLHSIFRVKLKQYRFVVRVNLVSYLQHAFEFLCDEMASSIFASTELPIPKVCAIDLSRDVVPFDYEILEQCPGERLSAYEDPMTQYLEPKLLTQLGGYVAQIHQVPGKGFGFVDVNALLNLSNLTPVGLQSTWYDHISQSLQDDLELCQNIKALSPQESADVESFLSHAVVFMQSVEPVLLHGDLANHNTLVARGSISAILDWEDCLCGDPIFDIAYWGTFCRDYMLSSFLAGYQTTRELPTDFELRYWIYYLRISIAKTVYRHRAGLKDRPGRPAASLRIQKALERLRQIEWS